MRTELITRLFCMVDDKLGHVKKCQDAYLHPSSLSGKGVKSGGVC